MEKKHWLIHNEICYIVNAFHLTLYDSAEVSITFNTAAGWTYFAQGGWGVKKKKNMMCVTMETGQGVNYSKLNLTSPPSRPPLSPCLTGRVCVSRKTRGVRHSLTRER